MDYDNRIIGIQVFYGIQVDHDGWNHRGWMGGEEVLMSDRRNYKRYKENDSNLWTSVNFSQSFVERTQQ